MNPIQLHLMLNDIPIMGCFMGGAMLLAGYLLKSNDITKISYWFLFAVSVVAIVVYSTGNLAERMISTLPNVTEQITNTHEKSALFSFACIMILGAIAATAITLFRDKPVPERITIGLLLFTCLTSWFMIGTGNTGGVIRHTELREGHPDQQATIEQKKYREINKKKEDKPHQSRSGPIKNVIKLR